MKSQNFLKKLRIGVYDSSHSHFMTRIKSNMGKQDDFGFCESNHSLHMIRIMQLYESNYELNMSRITDLMLATASFDSSHTSYMTQITSYFTFFCLIWIKLYRWLKSWTLVTLITTLTWLESQEMDKFSLCWTCSTLLAHLTQINKCSWL